VREFPAALGRTCDAQYIAEFEAYRHLVRSAARSDGCDCESDPQPAPGHSIEVFLRNFTGRFYNYCDDLRVAILDSGRLGLVPQVAQPGDYCCILLGVPVPITLRLVKDNTYILVGESYVRGVMAGEVIESKAFAVRRAKEETIIII
jgi:hypothetical protein